MVTRDDFKLIVRAIRQLYTRKTVDSNGNVTVVQDPIPDQYTFNLWYSLLQDVDYPTLQKATQIYMQQNRFPPSPADIRSIVADIQNGPQEGAAVAWENVMRALSRANPTEEFAKLPDIVQRVVGGPGTLREWSRMDSTSLQSVQRPGFLKEYERIRNSQRKQAALQPSFRQDELPIWRNTTPQIADTVRQAGEKIPMPPELMEKLRRRLSGLDS